MPRSAIVGIVNITPDSFSDGGNNFKPIDALLHCQKLSEEGADILDLGAESTRPNATPVTPDEEWARLAPVLESALHAPWRKKVKLSVDTRHPETATRALATGVDMINDVSGLTNPAMPEALAASECGVIVMHSLDVPASKANILAADTDMVAFMRAWQQKVTECAMSHGIAAERLIFDPGLGFGKSAKQSFALLTHFQAYAETPQNWLIGHSRKSVFSIIEEPDSNCRDSLTRCASAFMMAAGAGYLRVHDVAGHVALRSALS